MFAQRMQDSGHDMSGETYAYGRARAMGYFCDGTGCAMHTRAGARRTRTIWGAAQCWRMWR